MKIACDVCERAEAAVLCCADEAALCWGCDEKVHAANKLAGKHQRVPLLPSRSNSNPSSPQIPTCDICQEKAGYFFCLEDRALLCRTCDVAIHTASPQVSSHQRYLITGVRVALQQHILNNSSGSNANSGSSNNQSSSSSSNGHSSNPLNPQPSNTSFLPNKLRASNTDFTAEYVEGFRSQWPWNEILGGAELDRYYGITEPGSSS